MTHNLKCWSAYYTLVAAGIKTFEIRLNDRNFQKHDILCLQEYNEIAKKYTGNCLFVNVLGILRNVPGVMPDYVCLLIELKD